ncbi:hypothetical protein [Simplicispira suum]|uniref:Uncharacterized protein n=1 Tax=Simplicispira suum TaxID=2109915 RepID=A0A2S0N2U1_9BURK|nr:hypothetical protein [Simplicispira suum]AVO42281.1 hypothetical protein C6571_14130 [Simplicispira suum]MBW7831696.1 hypothetical protein [Simplicispira suum]
MTDAPIDFSAAVFSKTPAGQQEIQTRALGLSPLARRLLVLIDGKRTGKDLEPFVAGHSLAQYIDELLGHACIDMKVVAPAAPPASARAFDPAHPQPTDALAPTDWLAVLPPAETRSDKELEMARNFMINTVNNIFGHHNRISLVESIFVCKSTSELRNVYSAWASALETTSAGHKRLPELREKLFAVL